MRDEKRRQQELLKTFPKKYSGDNAPEKMKNDKFKKNEKAINTEIEERYRLLRKNGFLKEDTNEAKGITTGGAANISGDDPNSKKYSDKSFLNFDGISLNGTRLDDWTEDMKESFIEGFESNSFHKPNKKQNNWTDKFNIGDPNTDDGHWITLDNGKHLFIKNK